MLRKTNLCNGYSVRPDGERGDRLSIDLPALGDENIVMCAMLLSVQLNGATPIG